MTPTAPPSQLPPSTPAATHSPAAPLQLPAEVEELIRQLEMVPHPEGGYYKETFRDEHGVGGASSAASAPAACAWEGPLLPALAL